VKETEKSVTLAAGASQSVSFSLTREEAASYSVNVNGLSGSFTVAVPVSADETPVGAGTPINWTLIWIIIAAVIVVGLIIFFVARRSAD
jgi:carbon monoxide dehydrogenase subunit G